MHGRSTSSARAAALLAGASVLALPPLARVAHADAASDAATAADLTKPAERRSGWAIGFNIGLGVAGASGYPNASSDIGVAKYYDGSDAMGGGSFTIMVMRSLSDWLSFGAFYSRANFRSGQWNTFGGGGGFRVDLFPLYRIYPKLRDLGVYGQFGIGTSTLSPNYGTRQPATGTESFLAGGAFYEFFLGKGLGGHFAAGPSVEFDSQITQSNQRYYGLLGGRVVFYTGR